MQLTALSLALTRIGLGGFGVGSSLNLDFTSGNQTLDPRITFSRASNATVTGPDGTLQYAPHNLLTFSEQFDNAAWTKTELTVSANQAVAPDGTLSADQIVESTTVAATHVIFQSAGSAAVHTLSVYAKPNGRPWINLRIAGTSNYFNISTGVLGTISGGNAASITAVGNGWYRCSVAATMPGVGAVGVRLSIANENDVYTGDGTSGVFLWGAQLNVGPLQPYYPTTVKNLLGFTQEFDNAAWTKSNSFVQTNLLTWSEQFDNAVWSLSAATITPNAAVSPDGVQNAEKIVENLTFSNHYVAQTPTLADNTNYTVSVYFKAAERIQSRIQVRNKAGTFISCYYNLDTGTLGSTTNSPIDPFIVDAGNGWFRVGFTYNSSTGANLPTAYFYPAVSTNTNYTGDGTSGVFLWGAQLVQGSTPGDYQRTEGTARAVMYPAPDGSRTADKLVEDAANTQHRMNQSAVTLAGTQYTHSIYMKAGERTVAATEAVLTTGGVDAVFNLALGTVITSAYGGAAAPSGSITAVGNGWYRCAMTFTANGASATVRSAKLYQNSTTQVYTGDGTSGIYIWGAQLSDSASLDPYVYNPGAAPAAAAYYGPRFDYDPVTLAPRGLLIEEQRTNRIRNNTMQGAVAGTPGTLPTNWSSSFGGLTQQIVGVVTHNGVPCVDIRFSGTTTATSTQIRFEGSNNVAATNGQAFAASMWVQIIGGTTTNITSAGIGLNQFDSSTVYVGDATRTGASLVIGSDFSRSTSTLLTINNSSTAFVRPYFFFSHSSGVAIDITLRIGMPQLELGAFATSVIPTSGAAATRAADVAVMTGANFSNWYRQDDGALYVEAVHAAIANAGIVSITDGTASNRMSLQTSAPNAMVFRFVSGSGGFTSTGISYTAGSIVKSAFAYRASDQAAAVNTSLAVGVTSQALVPVSNQLLIGQAPAVGYINGHIRRIAYFPRRLSNAELQGITS